MISSIPSFVERPLLSVRGLSVSIAHRLGAKEIIRDVSLDVAPGQIVGVVGESGAGKSTVGNAIIGLLDPPAQVDSGQMLFKGKDLNLLSRSERAELRGRQIAMIFQDPQTALDPLMSIGRQIAETLQYRLKLSSTDAYKRTIELLKQVGISDGAERFDAYPHQFSGGMRQRVVIALALSAEPSVIVADEPTTALDVTLQRQILSVIQRACRERGLGVVLITHNMGVIGEVADRVVVMRHGRVVEQGLTADVLGKPNDPYTRSLIASVPRIEGSVRTVPKKSDHTGAASAATPAIDASGLRVSFVRSRDWLGRPNAKTLALDDVSLTLYQGESLGIVGESGCGKSTLARCITAITAIEAGNIKINTSEDGRKASPQPIQMIFQDPYASLNPGMRVGDIVGEALDYYRICSSRIVRDAKVVAALDRVGLPRDAIFRFPHQFSGGQRQRISIARALICDPRILVCDEPTSALDVSVQHQILELLEELQREERLSILFISHDLAVVRRICTRVAVMRKGKIVEIGDVNDVFDRPVHQYTRELLDAMPSTASLAPLCEGENIAVA